MTTPDFASKMDRSGGPESCWPWTGSLTSNGYGRMSIGGREVRANRLVLESVLGRPLGPLHALHRCDNPPCVNPAHLYAGTNHDNILDRLARGPKRPRKTHCPHGHEFTPENTIVIPGARRCRTCVREARWARKEKTAEYDRNRALRKRLNPTAH